MIITIFLAALILFSTYYSSAEVRDDAVSAQIIPQYESLKPGSTFEIGVLFKMESGWHIYWENPGDAGLPTVIDWEMPVGFEIINQKYPYPSQFGFSVFANYGYEKEVLISTVFKAPEKIENGELIFRAECTWLMCKEKCIKGGGRDSIALKQAQENSENDKWKNIYKKYESKYPVKINDFSVISYKTDETVVLKIINEDQYEFNAESLLFFPLNIGIFNHGKSSKIEENKNGLTITLHLDEYRIEEPKKVTGVLVGKDNIFRNRTEKALYIESQIE